MFNIMGSFAEFERELIRERTLLGLERARKRGKRIGRPPISRATENKIVALLNNGTPISRIAVLARCGVSVVYRVRKELQECLPTSH